MNKAKLPYHEIFKNNVDICVRILDLPTPSQCDENVVKELKRKILDCFVSYEFPNHWLFKLVVSNPPFKSTSTQHILLSFKPGCQDKNEEEYSDKEVWGKFLDAWTCICRLYPHAQDLNHYLCGKFFLTYYTQLYF